MLTVRVGTGALCLLVNIWCVSHLISREHIQDTTVRVVIVRVENHWAEMLFLVLIWCLSLLPIIKVVKVMQLYLEPLNVLMSQIS